MSRDYHTFEMRRIWMSEKIGLETVGIQHPEVRRSPIGSDRLYTIRLDLSRKFRPISIMAASISKLNSSSISKLNSYCEIPVFLMLGQKQTVRRKIQEK